MIEEEEFFFNSPGNIKFSKKKANCHENKFRNDFSPSSVSDPPINLVFTPKYIPEVSPTDYRKKECYSDNRIYQKKTEQLKLFSQSYNQLICDIKSKKISKSRTPAPCKNIKPTFSNMCESFYKRNKIVEHQKSLYYYNSEDFVINLTNCERVSDFYEYTENCMQKILNIEQPKPEVLKKVKVGNDSRKKLLALIDLDETLVHCTGKIDEEDIDNDTSQHIIEVILPLGKKIKVGINIRPHLKQSLDMMKQYYTLVLYTASHQSYTDAVLNLIDPDKEYFKYRLYRNNCIPTKIDQKQFFIKDLSIIEDYSLENIVIIDNSVLSFAYHINNGIPIVPYYEGNEDSELPILAYYLISIRNYKDLREANKLYIKLDDFFTNDKKDLSIDESSTEEETPNIKNIRSFSITLKKHLSCLREGFYNKNEM